MASRQRFDNFEGYALGNMTLPTANGYWQSDSGRLAPDVVSSSLDGVTGPHSGTKMCRLNYDTLRGTTLNEYTSIQQNPSGISYTNELFYRYWIRFDADHGISPPGTEAKFARIFTTSPVYNDVFYDFAGSPSAPEFDLVVLVNGGYIGGKTYISTPTAFTQWQKMEMYLNFSTGTLRVWLNGNQVFTTSGANLSAGRWLDFYPQSNWGAVNNDGYRNGSNNHMYFDDLEIFSDVGTGATGLMSNASIQAGSGGGDTTPPTNPSSLSAISVSTSQINLSWTASTDAVGVTNYLVERALGAGSFAQVGTSVSTTFNSTGLTESATYRFQVRATDAAGNLSGYSNIVTQVTISVPPAAPTNVRIS